MFEVRRPNCYVLPEVDPAQAIPDEFSAATLLGWSDRLTAMASCQAVVGLILKFDAMSRVPMPSRHRALLLHLVEDPLRRVFAAMPTLGPGAGRVLERRGWDLTMEQRLACAVYRNLKQTLEELDAVPAGTGPDPVETRLWVLEHQFGLLERQVVVALRTHLPVPSGTWLELHGRYRYFLQWCHHGSGGEAGAGLPGDFDPLAGYKRLLLLGIAAGLRVAEAGRDGFMARLRGWVADTRLEALGTGEPEAGAWVVDPTRDAPCRSDHRVVAGRGAWMLVPAPGFAELTQDADPANIAGPSTSEQA